MGSKIDGQSDEAEKAVRDIRRATRRHFSAEDKIRIVIAGLRGASRVCLGSRIGNAIRSALWDREGRRKKAVYSVTEAKIEMPLRPGPSHQLLPVQPEGFSPDLARKWVNIQPALTSPVLWPSWLQTNSRCVVAACLPNDLAADRVYTDGNTKIL
jgi:hypothetical protein